MESKNSWALYHNTVPEPMHLRLRGGGGGWPASLYYCFRIVGWSSNLDPVAHPCSLNWDCLKALLLKWCLHSGMKRKQEHDISCSVSAEMESLHPNIEEIQWLIPTKNSNSQFLFSHSFGWVGGWMGGWVG